MKEDYIDSYQLRISLNGGLDDLYEFIYTEHEETTENDLEEIYLTKEKIEELKQKFIQRIQESENPFKVYCTDTDCFEKELLLKHNSKLPELYKFPEGYVKTPYEELLC